MTYLDAAYAILTESGEPLHYVEITRRALEQDLISPSGLTPEATMGSRLYTETKQEGAQFVRVGRGTFGLTKQQPSGIDAQVQRINQETRTRLRELLHTMPPDRFEALVMELLLRMGFDESTVTVTPYQGDGGIDVTGIYRAAGLTEVNAAVQVKRWKRNVSAPAITQLRGSLQVHQQGIIITTSDYSKGARREAAAVNKTRIGLINGDELIDLLVKHEIGVQEKTLQVVGLDDEWWGEILDTDEAQASDEGPIETPAAPEPPTDKPSRSKPTSVTLFGETQPVKQWKAIWVTVCTQVAQRHPANFADIAGKLRGRKRSYISDDMEAMFRPQRIGGSDLWVETNLSAKDCVRLSHRLLELFGHDESELQIECS